MKRFYLLLIILVLLNIIGCGIKQPEKSASNKMLVAVSIVPLHSFARAVGGDFVDVELIVPPGASSHTYQPTPDQMKLVSNAKILVLNGLNLEFWADKMIDAAGNPKLLVVETAKGIPVIKEIEPEDLDNHPEKEAHNAHVAGNPHVWLNPIYAIKQVEAIRDTFIKADAKHIEAYNKNAAEYILKLKSLDKQIKQTLAKTTKKDFIAFHPAWVYFTKQYGLNQVGVVEKSPGKEPSISEINEVITSARKYKVRVIFAEKQFNPKAAQVIADESGIKVLILDPLGTPPNQDYIKNMQNNVKIMAEALK